MLKKAAGPAILDGFDQEYERVGGDWQSTHVSIPNSPVAAFASSGADTHGS
jgi:hypothetical protein